MLRSLFLSAALIAATAAPALAVDFTLDKAHAQAEFVVTHLTLSRVHGQIPLVSGTMTIGPNNLPSAANATFDVASVDTHDAHRDTDLRDNYFETAKYPTMTFVETKITGTPDAFVITGNLTMHGVTKPVTLNGKVVGTATVHGKKHVAFNATGTLDRRDWGMTFGKVLDGAMFAGYDVTLNIEADATEV